jgi:hypothetical protein
MFVCVCCIFASSKITWFDLGWWTPHFWGGSVTSLPPSDGQHLPPPYVPPPNGVVFKSMHCFILRERARATWFVAQGPSLLDSHLCAATWHNMHFAPSSSLIVESLLLTKGAPITSALCGALYDTVILLTLTLVRNKAPLRRGRDHTPHNFTEGDVESFRHGDSCITQI